MLPGRGALRSVSSAARRAPLAAQSGSSTRGYATSRIGGGRHVLPTGASSLTRLRSGAVAGPVFGQTRALSLWGSKKPDPPATQTPATDASAQATASPQPAADVAAAADTTSATQSGGWSPWGWGSKSAPQPPAELPAQAAQPPAEPAATTSAVSDPAATSSVHPDTVSSDLSQIITSDLDAYGSVSAIPETIGYLNTLGIEFGFGTTAVLQWLLEHLHVYSGFPWWGSILATSILLRAVLWKPIMMGQEASTRLAVMKQKEPDYAKAQEAWKVAMTSKDTMGVQATKMVMKKLEDKHGVNKLMPFISFVQIPIGFGMFRIIKAMSELPVPSLENGGCLWFTDLTVPDPWYILPLVGPVAMLATMRLTSRYSSPQQYQMMKTMTTVFVPLGLLFTAWLPAGLQFYFVTAGATGFVQTSLMFNPRFRGLVGLSPLPAPIDPPAQPPGSGQGYLASFKEAFNRTKEAAGSKISESSKKKEGQARETEEARLQAEYYESLRERMAELEKKMKRRP